MGSTKKIGQFHRARSKFSFSKNHKDLKNWVFLKICRNLFYALKNNCQEENFKITPPYCTVHTVCTYTAHMSRQLQPCKKSDAQSWRIFAGANPVQKRRGGLQEIISGFSSCTLIPILFFKNLSFLFKKKKPEAWFEILALNVVIIVEIPTVKQSGIVTTNQNTV